MVKSIETQENELRVRLLFNISTIPVPTSRTGLAETLVEQEFDRTALPVEKVHIVVS